MNRCQVTSSIQSSLTGATSTLENACFEKQVSHQARPTTLPGNIVFSNRPLDFRFRHKSSQVVEAAHGGCHEVLESVGGLGE